MKIAIISDFHLGYSDDAYPQAKEALEKAREVADAVIVAGDLFDVRVPKQEVVNQGIQLFKQHCEEMKKTKANAVKINKGDFVYETQPVIAIHGTHERRTKGLVNVVEMLNSTGLVANCHNNYVVIEKNGEKAAVLGMGGVPEEYVKQVIEKSEFKPLEKHFNIFVFHQTIKEVIPLGDKFISCGDLPPGFDLYIDGHIHWRRDVKTKDKLVLLPGSTVITQMRKNETEKKGFYLYDTQAKKYEFIYINSRPFFFKEITFENATIDKIKEEVEKIVREILASATKPLIKIKINGSLAKGVNSSSIEVNALASQFNNAEVYIDKEFAIVESLKEKIELLRKLKTEEKSVSELGIAILKEKLKQNKFQLKNEEELFSLLCEGEVDKAVALVKKS